MNMKLINVDVLTQTSCERPRLVRQVTRRNPVSIYPAFWTPESVAKHQRWQRMGMQETLALQILPTGSEEGDRTLFPVVNTAEFLNMLMAVDEGLLKHACGDWTAPRRAVCDVVGHGMRVVIDVNRTTIQGVPVVEIEVHKMVEENVA